MEDLEKRGFRKPGRATKSGRLPKRFPDRDALIQAGKPMSVMVDRLQSSVSCLSDYISRTGQKRIWKERLYRQIFKLARRGVPLVVIAKKCGYACRKSVSNFLTAHGLYYKWRESRVYYRKYKREKYIRIRLPTRNEIADRLVTSGLSLETIAQQSGWEDRRWTWGYYRRTGQLELYHQNKPGFLNYVALLINGLIHHLEKQMSTDVALAQMVIYGDSTPAQKKTFEYFQSVPCSRYSWVKLEEGFTRYFNAKEKGETPSARELCDGLGLSGHQFYTARRTVNLPSLRKYRYYPPKIHVEKKQEELPISYPIRMGINETQQIAHILQMIQTWKYSNASDAEKRTYKFSMFHSYYSPESVLVVITRYITAKTNREKLSMEELGMGVIPKWGVESILKFFNWKPLYKTPERLTSEQKEALQRVFPLHVSSKDIAYLMGLTYQSVEKNFHRIGKRPFYQEWVDYLGPVKANRLASKIYGAVDLGFTIDETVGLYNTKRKIVEYAIDHRQTIEPKIISVIKELHPCREINKPYLEELL